MEAGIQGRHMGKSVFILKGTGVRFGGGVGRGRGGAAAGPTPLQRGAASTGGRHRSLFGGTRFGPRVQRSSMRRGDGDALVRGAQGGSGRGKGFGRP